jgi:PhnB protein
MEKEKEIQEMATLNPYLSFEGDCKAAMEFYRDCFGGTLRIMTVGESPMAAAMPAQMHSQVMHASLEAEGIAIMASDMLDGATLTRGNGTALMLQCGSEEEIRRLFGRLSAGGIANTPVKVEFWGAMYGDLTDRFGVRWMLNFEKKA